MTSDKRKYCNFFNVRRCLYLGYDGAAGGSVLQYTVYAETDPAGGRIINIGSMVSWIGGTDVPPYTAAKGAVTQLTKSIASDCAKYKINCNAIAPGYMVVL